MRWDGEFQIECQTDTVNLTNLTCFILFGLSHQSCIAMYIQSNFSNYREQLRKHGGKSSASEGGGVLEDITNASNNSATGSACDQLPAGSSDEDPSDDDDDL